MARYFPVKLDINDDAQVWELTDLYGPAGLRIWLEVLSILEKTRNRWELSEPAWKAVFRKCRCKPANGWQIASKLLANRWLMPHKSLANDLQMFIGSPNYWKYHTRQFTQDSFTWETEWSLLTYPNLTSSSHTSYAQRSAPSAPAFLDLIKTNGRGNSYMGRSQNLAPELKAASDAVYYSDPKKFKDLMKWINHGRKQGYSVAELAKTLRDAMPAVKFVDEWYPYLEAILAEVRTDQNIALSDKEHFRRKDEEARPLQGPLAGLVHDLADGKKV